MAALWHRPWRAARWQCAGDMTFSLRLSPSLSIPPSYRGSWCEGLIIWVQGVFFRWGKSIGLAWRWVWEVCVAFTNNTWRQAQTPRQHSFSRVGLYAGLAGQGRGPGASEWAWLSVTRRFRGWDQVLRELLKKLQRRNEDNENSDWSSSCDAVMLKKIIKLKENSKSMKWE